MRTRRPRRQVTGRADTRRHLRSWWPLFMLAIGALPVTAEVWLLTGATVHTVSGNTFEPGQVLIRDGKIAAVGSVVSADGAEVLDLAGLHLFPGLIAANTSLGLLEIEAVRATLDAEESGTHTPDVRSWVAVNPDSDLIPVARANGITHFQPVPFGGVISGSSAVMATTGWTTEDMLMREPVALHLKWPSMQLDTTPKEALRDKSKWKSLEDQAKDRRAKLKEIDDFFAEAEAYHKARTAEPGKTPLVPAWEAVLPLFEKKIPLMIHASEQRQIEAALAWIKQRNYPVILADARDAWRLAKELAEAKIDVIYGDVFTVPARDNDAYDTHFRAPAILHEAGVKVSFGYGVRMEASSLRNLPYVAAQAVAYGLPAAEALKGLTLYPAQILGVSDRLGSIEPGKDATLLAVTGDILDVRAHVVRLWINGRSIDLETRHTRLYEKFRAREIQKPLNK